MPNINLQNRGKKLISIVMIFIIIYTAIYTIISPKKAYAITQTRNIDANNIYNIDETLYPGYAKLLQDLKSTHPNWTFTLLYTDLEWSEVLLNETIVNHERSLVEGKTGEWLCTYVECDGVPHDGSTWFGASQTAVAYFMDPRNFLTEDKIFQFETLSYIPSIHTEEGIEAVLKGTFMYNTKICDYYGNVEYGEKTFAQAIMEAAVNSNVSPYHIASRIRQEVGANGSGSTSGKVSGYEGYFNFYNIGAYASSDPVINGLEYAKSESVNWNNPEKAIIEGAKWIATSYTSKGQDSLYLQKWDVDNQYLGLYGHQYMTNIEAPTTESATVYSGYKDIFNNDLTNTSFNFIIPMYKNIPAKLSRYPSSSTYVSQNAQIVDKLGVGVYIRETPEGTPIGLYGNEYSFIRLEIKAQKLNNVIWDKVMLSDGTIGYIATQYVMEKITRDEISKEAYINSESRLLNGPRVVENGTADIRILYEYQPVTIIEEGKYTFDEYEWYKIRLADGIEGYIQKNYVTEGQYGEEVKITCDTELALRYEPSGSIIRWINPGVIVNRIEEATTQTNGYYWDKVITQDGIVGYMARERYNPYALWLTPVNDNETETPSTSNSNFAINDTDKIIKTIPNTNLSTIQGEYPNATLVSGTENLGTGSIIKIDEVEYTIVKLGDVNGDGAITSADYVRIKNILLEKVNPTNEQRLASDANNDNKTSSADYVRIKNYILEKANIKL